MFLCHILLFIIFVLNVVYWSYDQQAYTRLSLIMILLVNNNTCSYLLDTAECNCVCVCVSVSVCVCECVSVSVCVCVSVCL